MSAVLAGASSRFGMPQRQQLIDTYKEPDSRLPAQIQSSKFKNAGGWVGDILDRQVGTIRVAILLSFLGLLNCNPLIMCGVLGHRASSRCTYVSIVVYQYGIPSLSSFTRHPN